MKKLLLTILLPKPIFRGERNALAEVINVAKSFAAFNFFQSIFIKVICLISQRIYKKSMRLFKSMLIVCEYLLLFFFSLSIDMQVYLLMRKYYYEYRRDLKTCHEHKNILFHSSILDRKSTRLNSSHS